jgi:hypothetical protein
MIRIDREIDREIKWASSYGVFIITSCCFFIATIPLYLLLSLSTTIFEVRKRFLNNLAQHKSSINIVKICETSYELKF